MGAILVIMLLIRLFLWLCQWVREHWTLVAPVAATAIWLKVHTWRIKARRRAQREQRIQRQVYCRNKLLERQTRAYLETIAASGIDEIDSWSKGEKGVKFEDRMAIYFESLGCSVRKTRTTGDFGADLIVYNPQTRKKAAIQCKCYDPKHKVDISAVQAALAGMHHYRAHYAMVITNSRLTKNAKQLAESTKVNFWERQELIRRLASEKRKRKDQRQIQTETPNPIT